MAAQDLDSLGQRDGLALVDRGALLGLGQAGALTRMQRRLGGRSPRAERGQKKRR